MAISKEDLHDFSRFADEKLNSGETTSLVELAAQWEARRLEIREIELDIRKIHPDVDAETLRLLAAAFPEPDERQLQRAFARRGGATTAQMLANAASAAEKAAQG